MISCIFLYTLALLLSFQATSANDKFPLWTRYLDKSLETCHQMLIDMENSLSRLNGYLDPFTNCYSEYWKQCQTARERGSLEGRNSRPCYYQSVTLSGVQKAYHVISELHHFQINLTFIHFSLKRNVYGCDLQFVKVSFSCQNPPTFVLVMFKL